MVQVTKQLCLDLFCGWLVVAAHDSASVVVMQTAPANTLHPSAISYTPDAVYYLCTLSATQKQCCSLLYNNVFWVQLCWLVAHQRLTGMYLQPTTGCLQQHCPVFQHDLICRTLLQH